MKAERFLSPPGLSIQDPAPLGHMHSERIPKKETRIAGGVLPPFIEC